MSNTISFSTLNRNEILHQLEEQQFDLLVIGGGITGSGIALDAITRGLKVALVERYDFASGTSSRSGKLIHGGLKYLQNFDFPVVKEIGSERDIVYNNALHLVYPITMNFPLIKKESYNLVTLKAGLTLYDKLAGVKKEEHHTLYGKKKTLQNEPLFNKKIIKGSGSYIEYRTDDSRLTLEVTKTAKENGAVILNYAEMTEFLKDENNRVKGIVGRDHYANQTFTVYAKYIVNAAGPWVDKVRNKDEKVTGKHMVLAKGIHIVFPYDKLPVKSSVYFQHKGRMIAVIPVRNRTYVGSTESLYHKDMDDIHVHLEEVQYLLNCLKDMFPKVKLQVNDVTSSWAGIRPLIGEAGKKPSELSRHDEIFESTSGVVTIAGGKLTGYRKMADRVLAYLDKKHKLNLPSTKTADFKLSGSQFNNIEDLYEYTNRIHGMYSHLGFSQKVIHEYVLRYGSNTEKLLQTIDSYGDQEKNQEERNILGELRYTIENEMVTTLTDFYDRRTSYLLFDLDLVKKTLNIVAEEMAKLLQWNESMKEKELRQMQYQIKKALHFQKD